jgi:hypothetical protein
MKASLTAANTEPKPSDEDYDERKGDWVFNPNIDKIV